MNFLYGQSVQSHRYKYWTQRRTLIADHGTTGYISASLRNHSMFINFITTRIYNRGYESTPKFHLISLHEIQQLFE